MRAFSTRSHRALIRRHHDPRMDRQPAASIASSLPSVASSLLRTATLPGGFGGGTFAPVTAADHRPSAPAHVPAATMLYCHDTYGLGHLRRTLSVAAMLSASPLGGAQLIVTGSPMEHRFALPPGTDSVKLPAVLKLGDERYTARSLRTDFGVVSRLRRELILAAAREFRPDLVLVDHAPAGVAGEVVAALRHLRRASPATRIVLGLRDVIDDAPHVRRAWQREGIPALLDELYDLIVVYGAREVYDPCREYGFSPSLAARTRFVGYLRRDGLPRSRTSVLREWDIRGKRLVLVVAGGGGDGESLLETVIEGVRDGRAPDEVGWLLVGGPLMPAGVRARLEERARGLPGLRVAEFLPDLPGAMVAADAIVAMGGYNTICEVLSAGTPAVIVPRVEPRTEQLIRAARLERLGLLRTVHPAESTPEHLIREALAALHRPSIPAPSGLLGGLPGLERELERLLAPVGAGPPAASTAGTDG